MNTKILFIMLFLHLIDDFHLQGLLASFKQRDWWIKQIKDMTLKYEGKLDTTDFDKKYKLYGKDWIISLILHGFSWTFMVCLPYFITKDLNWIFFLGFFSNMVIHCLVDDLKANEKIINLTADQIIHIIQIIFLWFGFEKWL